MKTKISVGWNFKRLISWPWTEWPYSNFEWNLRRINKTAAGFSIMQYWGHKYDWNWKGSSYYGHLFSVRNWKILRMRFFIFAIFLAFLQAKNIRREKRDFWSKLDQYQKLTGISAKTIMAIWQRLQVMKSSDQQGCI